LGQLGRSAPGDRVEHVAALSASACAAVKFTGGSDEVSASP
jgi:hypothetical protein